MARMETAQSAPQALGGITAIELPFLDPMKFYAAPMAAKAFADLGAEVIKIEPPNGSAEREEGPFRMGRRNRETSGLHLYLNTNKFGVTLDLERERGRELLFRMLAGADIVFNSNPPALAERLGLDWRTIVARFPELIVASLTWFGADSPYRDLRGCDLIATHLSSVGYETPANQVTDLGKEPPLKMAGRQSDYMCGLTGATGAMMALMNQRRFGGGQHVDVSQWLSMVNTNRPNIGVYFHESADAPFYLRLFTREKKALPWLYPCKDGWVSFSPLTDRFWAGTKKLMNYPEWAESELFATRELRQLNVDALEAGLIAWLSDHTRREVFEAAQAEHIPCFPVNSAAEVAGNEQYAARGFFASVAHPEAGVVRMPGAPYQFSRTPWRIVRAAPRLGEHNRKIYLDRLEIGERDFRALQDEGVI
ncbi:MAG: CaiB/BaiF CoA transferase family protein [Candidatus Binataceae bacterium]